MQEISDVSEIQKVLIGILSYFKEICEVNGLTFFLSNGSLLGAVKYKGFIKWDDDIDVIMPRKDYDRLMTLAGIDCGPYRLLCRETTPEWRMPYAKLTNIRTVVQEGCFDFGVEFGVSMDIFPIDQWHPIKAIASVQAIYCEILKRLLVFANADCFFSEKRGIKRFILYCMWRTGRALGHEEIYRLIIRRTRKSGRCQSRHQGCVAWTSHSKNDVLPAAVFGRGTTMWFCNDEYPVPVGYAQYLDSLYGDWKKDLPPEKQRSNHMVRAWWKHEGN